MNFGLIASCIPTLKPLLQHINEAIKTRRRGNYSSFAPDNDNARPLGIHRTIRISHTSHAAYNLDDEIVEAPRALKPLPRLYIEERVSTRVPPSSCITPRPT